MNTIVTLMVVFMLNGQLQSVSVASASIESCLAEIPAAEAVMRDALGGNMTIGACIVRRAD